MTSDRCEVVRSEGGIMLGATSGAGKEGSGGAYAPATSGGGDARDEWNEEVDEAGDAARSRGAMDASSAMNRFASVSRSSYRWNICHRSAPTSLLCTLARYRSPSSAVPLRSREESDLRTFMRAATYNCFASALSTPRCLFHESLWREYMVKTEDT